MDLPGEPQIRWILRTAASLLSLGAEPVRGLVLPTAAFFPDRFDGSPPAVAAILRRIQEHAGLSDLRVELGIVSPEGEAEKIGGCGSGACGPGGAGAGGAKLDRVSRVDDGLYAVMVGAGEVKHPAVLTTALVRATSFMFLTEAGAYDEIKPTDREAATDLAAVLLGFGVLVANGSYIYMKGCSGVQVHSATRMPVDELTLALAVFCKLHGVPERSASAHLELTPREHFDEGVAWASSNMPVVKMLRKSPDTIIRDDYKLSEARSWLARALGIGARKNKPTADDELAELERSLAQGLPAKKGSGAGGSSAALPAARDKAKAAKLAEIRALVDETLES
jgi:hypothetical protein